MTRVFQGHTGSIVATAPRLYFEQYRGLLEAQDVSFQARLRSQRNQEVNILSLVIPGSPPSRAQAMLGRP